MNELDRPAPPGAGSVQCLRCGSYVSRGFARVFGDNEDAVYRCTNCATFRRLRRGAATRDG